MAQDQTPRLKQDFYAQPTIQLAISLLGKRLVRMTDDNVRLSGIIVEVEAYLSDGDLASHSHRGRSKKNGSMFEAAGTLYVYPIHARHCLNIVTEEQGRGAAVLIRALNPIEGKERMRMLRALDSNSDSTKESSIQRDLRLTAGPARLCEALGVDRSHDGANLMADPRIWLEATEDMELSTRRIGCSQRIGISQSKELPLRWFLDGNRFVSGCSREHSHGRFWFF